MEFLNKQKSAYPDLSERYEGFISLFGKKLWHQLTVELTEFVLDKSTHKDKNLIDLYEHFISTFEEKLNQLKLVQICSVIARQHLDAKATPSAAQVEAAIAFLDTLEGKCNKDADNQMKFDANVVLKMAVAELYLQHPDKARLLQCKKILLSVEKDLLPLVQGTGSESIANSAFFRVSCGYFKRTGPAKRFYESAVQFLAYTPLESIEPTHRIELALDICFAALIAEDVFNFGEVIPQPILQELKGTENEWLLALLQAFHDGDIAAFSNIFSTNEASFQKYAILAQNIEILRQKIGVMCLLRIVFERSSEERTIEMDYIAKRVGIESKMAEWLVMRAMSKGLIKGKIDGVNRAVTVSWLKPRVLTASQLGMLEEKLTAWEQKVQKTSEFLSSEANELFA